MAVPSAKNSGLDKIQKCLRRDKRARQLGWIHIEKDISNDGICLLGNLAALFPISKNRNIICVAYATASCVLIFPLIGIENGSLNASIWFGFWSLISSVNKFQGFAISVVCKYMAITAFHIIEPKAIPIPPPPTELCQLRWTKKLLSTFRFFIGRQHSCQRFGRFDGNSGFLNHNPWGVAGTEEVTNNRPVAAIWQKGGAGSLQKLQIELFATGI